MRMSLPPCCWGRRPPLLPAISTAGLQRQFGTGRRAGADLGGLGCCCPKRGRRSWLQWACVSTQLGLSLQVVAEGHPPGCWKQGSSLTQETLRKQPGGRVGGSILTEGILSHADQKLQWPRLAAGLGTGLVWVRPALLSYSWVAPLLHRAGSRWRLGQKTLEGGCPLLSLPCLFPAPIVCVSRQLSCDFPAPLPTGRWLSFPIWKKVMKIIGHH